MTDWPLITYTTRDLRVPEGKRCISLYFPGARNLPIIFFGKDEVSSMAAAEAWLKEEEAKVDRREAAKAKRKKTDGRAADSE